MKIRVATFIKHFRFFVHDIRQAIQAYYRIQTDGRTDLNFNFEPVSSVSHSVKFSWFLSESIVLKVEIEDRNLVLALLQKIPGSAGNNIDYKCRFSLQLYTRMHGFQVCIFDNFLSRGSPSPWSDFSPTQSRAAPSIRASPSIVGRFAPLIDSSFALNSPPQTCVSIPPPTEGDYRIYSR